MSNLLSIIKRYYLADLTMPTEQLIELKEVCYTYLQEESPSLKDKNMVLVVLKRIDYELEAREEQHEI